jgi:hypothetical protein
MIRYFIIIIGTAALAHTLYLYTHREFGPSDFQHRYIQKRLPTHVDLLAKQEAEEILKQRFTYLGYGGQMTVYESEDHRYVLKFFNPRSVIKKAWFHRIDKLIHLNSFKWIVNTYFHQTERLEKYFHRYELSYQDLKEETGLVYIHLDPGTAVSQTVEVVTKEGVTHSIDTTHYPFVLQKKAELTMTCIGRLMKEGKVDEAKRCTLQIYELFKTRAEKGYKDPFQALEKNYGFVDGRAIQFDPGRLKKDPKVLANSQQELERVMINIQPAFKQHPELLDQNGSHLCGST